MVAYIPRTMTGHIAVIGIIGCVAETGPWDTVPRVVPAMV